MFKLHSYTIFSFLYEFCNKFLWILFVCIMMVYKINIVYIINRTIHVCLEIPDLFLVLNVISHSFAALTREISCSTLEINLVFLRTHVLFSIYHADVFYKKEFLKKILPKECMQNKQKSTY